MILPVKIIINKNKPIKKSEPDGYIDTKDNFTIRDTDTGDVYVKVYRNKDKKDILGVIKESNIIRLIDPKPHHFNKYFTSLVDYANTNYGIKGYKLKQWLRSSSMVPLLINKYIERNNIKIKDDSFYFIFNDAFTDLQELGDENEFNEFLGYSIYELNMDEGDELNEQ